MNLFKREPALIIGAFMAVIALAVTFGLPITAEQQQSLEDALWLILPLILAGSVATRQSVVAPANVVATLDKTEVVAGPASPIPDGTPVIVQRNTAL